MSIKTGTLNFIKHTKIHVKSQIKPNPIIVREFNTLLSLIKVIQRKKETLELNEGVSQRILGRYMQGIPREH